MKQRLEQIRRKLAGVWCFIKGHDMIDVHRMDNKDHQAPHVSYWGYFKCMRCKIEEHWQYDF